MNRECFSVWLSRVAVFVIGALSIAYGQVEGPGGHYYKVVREPGLLWQDAKSRAEQSTFNGVHGYLATITSAEEDQFIENLRQQAAPGGDGSLWVGGSQVGTAVGPTDGWYWVNGEGPIPTSAGGDGYSNWQQGEPSVSLGAGSSGYLSVGRSDTFGWNDAVNDGHITGYVVEYPSRGTTSQVSVRAVDPVAAEHPEISVNGGVDRAAFVFYRTGDVTLDLPVFYSVHGTAINGIDYIEIPKSIIIPAGKSEVRLEIVPNQDLSLDGEPMETVGIRIEPSQILTPTAAYYIDQNQREAGAVIYETGPPGLPTAEVAVPRNGFSYKDHEPVVFLFAMYSDIAVTTVEFYVDGVSIGTAFDTERTTGLRFLRMIWPNPTPGTHTLVAHAAAATSRASSLIQFSVEGTAEPTKVGIRFVPPSTTDPLPDADYAPGYLEVTRTGSAAQNLQVFYSVGGTATADVDYEALQGYVVIPAGRSSAKFVITAKDDAIDEPNETVIVTLINSPNATDAAAQYIIDPDRATAQVTIVDNDPPPDFPLVRIDAVIDHTSENGADAFGKFRISRSGSTTLDLVVVMQYSGTATPDVDYHKLPEHVTIPAGAQATEISVEPIADQIAESDETVIAILAPIRAGVYNVDQSHQSATVVIRDVAPPPAPPPVAKITMPADGATFLETDTIHVVASATDPVGTVVKIEILLDDAVVAGKEGAVVEKDVVAAVGVHTLTARAMNSAGGIGISAPVHILVRHPDTVAFVRRELPPGYSPGVSFVVALRADPPEGTFAYALEDRPPTGWSVTDVSDDGAFDSTTGKVKFGPFVDDTARTLTYRVTPPANAIGRYEFAGSSSVNGALYPITGDAIVELALQYHPADSNQDWQISLAEVTAYAAAWKAGNSWPTGPVPIPMRYVTRAHLIWQHGEVYRFEPAAGAPPACWVAGNSGPRAALAVTAGGAQRSVISDLRSGAATQVKITAAAPSGSSGYAVEEKPPRGWVVSNVSNDGVFDAVTGTIRWGVFADTTTRTLSYTVTPPPTVTSVGVFAGQMSFDGQVVEVSAAAGTPNSVTSSGASEIRINNFTQMATGTALNISGPTGQTAVLESSTDFTNWTEVKSIFIPNGSVNCTDESAAGGRRFYRLRAQ